MICSKEIEAPFLANESMAEIKKITRSENMRRIRSIDTKPELALRSFLHSKGYRFRLHDPRLPGKPDVIFPTLKRVIFVHGCFWHQHKNCRLSHVPKSNLAYWRPKLRRNRTRYERNVQALRKLGWKTLVIWECQIRKLETHTRRIVDFLQRELFPLATRPQKQHRNRNKQTS